MLNDEDELFFNEMFSTLSDDLRDKLLEQIETDFVQHRNLRRATEKIQVENHFEGALFEV